jgi:hypothetical protein
MGAVYLVEICESGLSCTRYPVAVAHTEELAMQAAERHFARDGRRRLADWTRPPHRGAIVAVLRVSYSREYEVWRLDFI